MRSRKKPPDTTLRLTGLPLQGRTYDTQGDSRQCFLSSLHAAKWGSRKKALPYYTPLGGVSRETSEGEWKSPARLSAGCRITEPQRRQPVTPRRTTVAQPEWRRFSLADRDLRDSRDGTERMDFSESEAPPQQNDQKSRPRTSQQPLPPTLYRTSCATPRTSALVSSSRTPSYESAPRG